MFLLYIQTLSESCQNADKASLWGDFCMLADNLQTSSVVLISANMQTANIIKPSLFNTKDEDSENIK